VTLEAGDVQMIAEALRQVVAEIKQRQRNP
jgi:hypothetical protein